MPPSCRSTLRDVAVLPQDVGRPRPLWPHVLRHLTAHHQMEEPGSIAEETSGVVPTRPQTTGEPPRPGGCTES